MNGNKPVASAETTNTEDQALPKSEAVTNPVQPKSPKKLASAKAAPVARAAKAVKATKQPVPAKAEKSAKSTAEEKPKAGKVAKSTNKSLIKPATNPAAKAITKPTKAEKSPKADKPAKLKLVRDSYTMPEMEYAQLAALKKTALAAGIEIKKSELLRLGLKLLSKLSAEELLAQAATLEKLKTGRPGKA